MIALLLIGLPIEAPPVEVDGDLAEPELTRWRSACVAMAERLPGPGVFRVRIRQATSIDDFVARSGRARFEAAALVGDVIWIQPAEVLGRFGDLDPIRRHECVHARLRHLRIPPLPRIVEEAVAIGLAGQRLPPAPPLTDTERAAAEAILRSPTDRAELERTLARAFATIWPRLPKDDPAALVGVLRAGL
jgi:hypothetical protein